METPRPLNAAADVHGNKEGCVKKPRRCEVLVLHTFPCRNTMGVTSTREERSRFCCHPEIFRCRFCFLRILCRALRRTVSPRSFSVNVNDKRPDPRPSVLPFLSVPFCLALVFDPVVVAGPVGEGDRPLVLATEASFGAVRIFTTVRPTKKLQQY